MQSSQDVRTPVLRADARRNREQIIEAARDLFIRVGTDVPMEEIAKTAGVGVGTLYRRFPDRDELIKAVSLDNFGRLLEVARRIEREETDPAKALGALLYSSLELRLGITMTTLSARSYVAIHESPTPWPSATRSSRSPPACCAAPRRQAASARTSTSATW